MVRSTGVFLGEVSTSILSGQIVAEVPGNPLISGKSRLVKYYSLARFYHFGKFP